MRLNKILLMTVVFAAVATSCKDQLDVKTNEPQATAEADPHAWLRKRRVRVLVREIKQLGHGMERGARD